MQEHVSSGYVAQGSWSLGNLFEYCSHSWIRKKMKELKQRSHLEQEGDLIGTF